MAKEDEQWRHQQAPRGSCFINEDFEQSEMSLRQFGFHYVSVYQLMMIVTISLERDAS